MGEEVLITDIFRKVTKDLENMETERKVLAGMLKDVRREMKSLDGREVRLRAKIAELSQREADLSRKKLGIEENLEKTRKRLQKMAEAKRSFSESF